MSTVTSYVSGTVASGSVLSITSDLNIAAGTQIGSYTFPVAITWGATTGSTGQSVSMIQNTVAIVPLDGTVQLQYSVPQPTLTPGAVTYVPVVISKHPARELRRT